MPASPETLCYHGRRSVDELVVAMAAGTGTAARLHKELSRLHLERFVAMMDTVAAGIDEPGDARR